MLDTLTDLLIYVSNKQRTAAFTLAEWIAHLVGSAVRPPTPVYLPKAPMAAEEIERVRWRSEQPPNE